MRKIQVVIQSRLTSSRLPAKALLPLAGMPSIVLCALRAANTGLNVVVTTSTDATDDIIVDTLAKNNIVTVRGPLDDVLERYYLATSGLNPTDIVVRLTGDNLFPDGNFVTSVTDQFMQNNLEYLGTHSPLDGLPYGISAEVFTVKALRNARLSAQTDFEREHVTPWIRKKYKARIFHLDDNTTSQDNSHLRCTLDTLEDYVTLQQVFNKVAQPENINWQDLVEILSKIPGAPTVRVPYRVINDRIHGILALGTVQIGMNYGIANKTGQPSSKVATQLINESIKYGITTFDCARTYGEAENRLGKALSCSTRDRAIIVTKLDTLDDLPENCAATCVKKAVAASIYRSCTELRQSTIDILLLHRWSHRYKWNQSVWEALLELQLDGVVKKIGASLNSTTEAIDALADPNVEAIQIPFNILDWRWQESEFTKAVEKKPDVIIHGRSALLQGLLTADSKQWPKIPSINAAEYVNILEDLVAQFGRHNKADLCYAYVRAHPWITSVIVGMETIEQLRENILLFQNPPLTSDQCHEIDKTLNPASEQLLNPSNWQYFTGDHS